MNIEVSPATSSDLTYIDHLQKKNAEELSFYPKVVFEREIENKRIILAYVNGDPAGYIYHGALGDICKIHQACIEYDLRGQLYGSELVRFFELMCKSSNVQSAKLRCGSNISANSFWKIMGFHCQSVTQGGVRRMRDINEWRKDFTPQLFQTSCEPSSKKADSSIWRKKRGTDSISSFSRGEALIKYREKLIAKK